MWYSLPGAVHDGIKRCRTSRWTREIRLFSPYSNKGVSLVINYFLQIRKKEKFLCPPPPFFLSFTHKTITEKKFALSQITCTRRWEKKTSKCILIWEFYVFVWVFLIPLQYMFCNCVNISTWGTHDLLVMFVVPFWCEILSPNNDKIQEYFYASCFD